MDMNVTTERLDDCQVKVVVEVDQAEIDKQLRQTARRISRQFSIPGYRKGRAPYHAVVRVFGREAVQREALDDFGNEVFDEALERVEYEPYQVGELQEIEWDPFRMTVLLPILPEVELGDYRSVRVSMEPEPVTDERIEERLAEFQREHTQWVPAERPAEFGDQVVVDFEGKVGDELIMDNENHEMELEKSGDLPMIGFHREVVGLSPDEEKTFTLTVPEEGFEEDVAGQEATVTVYLHTVREKDVPPLDDELAMMVGTYDTLDELRAALREEMETSALQKAESEYLDKILEAIIEQADQVEYPHQAIDREAEFMMSQIEQNLAGTGLDLDRYLGMLGKTREMYRQELHPGAEDRLQKRLVMNEIAEQEGLTVEEYELEEEIEHLIREAGPQAEQMEEMLETEGARLTVSHNLLMNKVSERVRQIAQGEAPPLPERADTEAEVSLEEGAEEGTDAPPQAEEAEEKEEGGDEPAEEAESD